MMSARKVIAVGFSVLGLVAFGAASAAGEAAPSVPVVERESVSSVTQFGAVLGGVVDPGGAVVGYHFAFVDEAGYRAALGEAAPDPYSEGGVLPFPDGDVEGAAGTEVVSQSVSGLQAGTTYHFALVVEGPAGRTVGPDETFTTVAVSAPAVVTAGVTGVTQTAAMLTGVINPQGWTSAYHFEYGTSAAYGQDWPTADLNAGNLMGEQGVSVYVEGLQPGTTYHYRLVAGDAGGSSYGADQVFTTPAYPAAVIQQAPVGFPVGIAAPSESGSIAPSKASGNARKLGSALRVCRRKPRGARAGCEKRAKKKYR